MSNKSFENYLSLAKKEAAKNIEVAGRYAFQAEAERNSIRDISNKLSLCSGDSLLEIGCGPGNLLLPLSYMVKSCAGIDNSKSLERLRARGGDAKRIELYPGNFLEMDLPEIRFDKILIYSVIQLVDDMANAMNFVSRALTLLQSGGTLMLGDIPNSDKKKRWLNTKSGQDAAINWKQQVDAAGEHPMAHASPDTNLVTVDDHFVSQVMLFGRSLGYETYLIPQKSNLPFGNTREDIIFVSRI
jgi:cyclopropane fatty-acyl-phospholipid synthase-like methyltransferase